jgi:hypothetical protein
MRGIKQHTTGGEMIFGRHLNSFARDLFQHKNGFRMYYKI